MNNPQNPTPQQKPAPSRTSESGVWKWAIKVIAGLLMAVVLAIGGYSIYVAVHEPDPQETILLGQTKIAGKSPAAFRIIIRNRISGQPIKGAEVVLGLFPKNGEAIKLGTFHTDESGSVADAIEIPDLAPGDYQLIVDSKSRWGRDNIVKKVELQYPVRVLLSSDKPIYQPGQTIHLRTLILNERTQKPFSSEPVTFEVSDPKGNKVFKETHTASAFGITSADFVLADELNLGRYEIRAIAGATTGERTVEIKRYVLPKFKIQILTDKPYYLPGQTVSGSVQASYFFGKPAGNGEVKLTVATLREQPVAITELNGRTDSAGKYSFQFVLPDFFAGMPQKAEQAFLDLTAEVRDAGQHLESKTLSLSVAQNDLEITAIPEAGGLVPGVENILYVLTTYPDGRPAACKVMVNGAAHQSDDQGVCAVKIVPESAGQQFEIQAQDGAGRNRKFTFVPESQGAVLAFILRTDQAVYEAGQTMHASLLSPEKDDTVYMDVIKDGQTVLTKSVPLKNHQAEYAFSLPSSLVGTLKINAYMISDTGEDRGCSRTIYVNPETGLHITAKASQPVYRPGETAKLDFTVTDSAGQPAPAALGIAAVDESVFALAENRPGLLQQFLDAEADLLKPRYQIKSFDSPAELIETRNQVLAQAYFASFVSERTGPTLDEMVKNGYLPDKIVVHIRSMRGTPEYESLRKDPQYAAILQTMEGEGSLYNLRETTGPIKLQAVEAHRKAYFNRLKATLFVAFLGTLFLLPIFLIIYNARPGFGIFPKESDTEADRKYVQLAASSYGALAALTLCPLLFYPVGGYFCDRWDIRNPGWLLLAAEVAVVGVTLAWQFLRISSAKSLLSENELKPFKIYLGAFLCQFALSRLCISLVVIVPIEPDELFAFACVIGSLVAPLAVLASLSGHLRRQFAARGLEVPRPQITVVGILVIIAMIFVLGAMLLPALASAKRKAQKINLMNDLKQVDLANRMAEEDGIKPSENSVAQPRIRRDFPETLFWRPEFITDDRGKASLEIPLADSITTWRATVDGVSAGGKLGSVELPIAVFQDFFADLDLPVSMSLNDQVSVPVTCYNYLKEPQDIHLTLAPDPWFESAVRELSLHLGAGEVKSLTFPIRVLKVGTHALRVTAQGTKLADAIEREVQVMPVGEQVDHTKNDVLKVSYTDSFTIPAEAIPDSQNLSVKFYPSRFSEVVEGLDSIFRAPYGCFEQTSSTTYPNVLVLDYMKRTGRLTPEIEIKARKLINAGYQRLLTFEVPGGGFEWFGRPPANICLTAYGILEFTDMAKVHPVDEAVTERARQWLFGQQNSDGSWDEIHRGWTWQGRGSMTSFVAWALAESGDQSSNLDKALAYLRSHPKELENTYSKALAANAFLAHDRNDAFGLDLVRQLQAAAVVDDQETIHWDSTGYSITYSHDSGMETECTALCAMALMKAGTAPQSVKQALTWISRNKFADGTLGSTQATILAMRALIFGSAASMGQEFDSEITVFLNDQKVEAFHINQSNSDVMKQINLTKQLHTGENRLEIRQVPAGELPVQITGKYWLPARSNTPSLPAHETEPLQIAQQYDRTTLTVNDQLKCTVAVRNNTGAKINMAIVDLGIPPGFDVDTSAFEAMQRNDQIAKFDATGNQVILYLRELSESSPFKFSYSLRAKYPLRVQSPPSAVYEYYEPTNRALSQAVNLQVAGSP